ncbi:Bug family tripartite tricarboxylate transporter substrate binding protein [Xanthobacter pseudotagetidis]|uniref:Bug family tripartite tricarboxylate transporter substrate binding protein n=1 Tax=Xanthobacter pseudotagetidis TaxID=3119911 RepID=UPI00372B070C
MTAHKGRPAAGWRLGLPALAALFGLALAGEPAPVAAQAYPAHPVKFVVPYPPGGGNDILARILSPRLAERLGQTFVVENIGGAGGNVGTASAARSAPDGYTILMANNAFVMNPSLYASLPFDVRKDFEPTAMISALPMLIVVNPKVKAGSLAELVALAKANPEGITYATPGVGTPQHLATELFAKQAGIKLRHVPYRGTGPAVSDTVGGHVDLMFATASSVDQYVKNGTLRVLGTSSEKRSPSFPDVPTVQEAAVPGYSADIWYGVLVPAKTPAAINDRLAQAIAATLAEPEVKEKLASLGYEPKVLQGKAFGALIDADLVKWKQVIDALGVKLD